MTRLVHKLRLSGDSTNAADVPGRVDLPAGYLDGNFPTVAALRKRFPHKRVIGITVNGSTSGADVIDREAGDVSAQGAAHYVRAERGLHHWPSIYFPLSDIGEVCRALKALGLGPDVPLWTAHYTGRAHICGADCLKPYGPLPFAPMIVATQYATPGIGVSGHFDLSLVADYWPGVDPKPAPPVPAKPAVTGTPLSGLSAALARQLNARLSRRTGPVTGGRQVLVALQAQITRVLGLK